MLPRSDLWRDYCLWLSVSAHSRLDTENYARVTVSSDVLTTIYIRFQLCNSALTLRGTVAIQGAQVQHCIYSVQITVFAWQSYQLGDTQLVANELKRIKNKIKSPSVNLKGAPPIRWTLLRPLFGGQFFIPMRFMSGDHTLYGVLYSLRYSISFLYSIISSLRFTAYSAHRVQNLSSGL